MTALVNEVDIRRFVAIISAHVVKIGAPGVLQIDTLYPLDKKLVAQQFRPDDIDGIVQAARIGARNGHNVYLEARTLKSGLNGQGRGTIDATESVFGLVIDSDADKGKAGDVKIRPSLIVETSLGNKHYWILFDRPMPAVLAKPLGDALRMSTGSDAATGVITQPYRIPGTPNFPSPEKLARGRTEAETSILEVTGVTWDPADLPTAAGLRTSATPPVDVDEASLPSEFLDEVRTGQGPKAYRSRSERFMAWVRLLADRRWTVDQIEALLAKHPSGVTARYVREKRLRAEVDRCLGKIIVNGSCGGAPPPPPGLGAQSTGASPQPGVPLSVLPTIRLQAGRLPDIVAEVEAAVLASGADVFARAEQLVRPLQVEVPAADGGRTVAAKLGVYTPPSFIIPVARSAIFQKFDARRNAWVTADPPIQLVQTVLALEEWPFPRIAGVITTPTLRPDGSLLDKPGFDPATGLYLMSSVTLPPIPVAPTRDDALEALAFIKDLHDEFPFRRSLDCSVAVAGHQTALLRGSLPTAPIFLIAASTPGVGKSYLVNVISAVVTGRACPAIAISDNRKETETRMGALLLAGSQIASLDNLTRDLDDEILCQIAEQRVIGIRILGLSEMPDCENHTMLFATGNNVGFTRDMVRRGLTCELEALGERPELRSFKHNARRRACADRARYIAAGLTIVRAYITAGAPRMSIPLGSYEEWSAMVRDPLIWLGEPDPVDSMEKSRAEDPELAGIRELISLWEAWLLLDWFYPTTRLIEIADGGSPNDLKTFFLKVAEAQRKPGEISPDRLGRWLKRISGRIVDGHRLERDRDNVAGVAVFRLVRV